MKISEDEIEVYFLKELKVVNIMIYFYLGFVIDL